jgi:hypothetical protein
MSIESTQFITKDEAVEKIMFYLSVKYGDRDFANFSIDQLDRMLHSLKYELDLDIFENYIITED